MRAPTTWRETSRSGAGTRPASAATSSAEPGAIRATCSARADAQLPFDRSATNGLRCVRYAAPVPAEQTASVERLTRDYSRETPASDETFRIYRGFYAYDKTPLNAASRVGGRQLTLLAQGEGRLRRRLWPRAGPRVPVPAAQRRAPLPDRRLFPELQRSQMPSSEDLDMTRHRLRHPQRPRPPPPRLQGHLRAAESRRGRRAQRTAGPRDPVVQGPRAARSTTSKRGRTSTGASSPTTGFPSGRSRPCRSSPSRDRFKTAVLLAGGLPFTARAARDRAVELRSRASVSRFSCSAAGRTSSIRWTPPRSLSSDVLGTPGERQAARHLRRGARPPEGPAPRSRTSSTGSTATSGRSRRKA